jgi:hypothetical protein
MMMMMMMIMMMPRAEEKRREQREESRTRMKLVRQRIEIREKKVSRPLRRYHIEKLDVLG